MDFVTFAIYVGFVCNVISLPGLLNLLKLAGKGVHWLWIWLCIRFSKWFWYLHCSRYCVKQIANGLVLSRNKSKNSDVETQPTSEEASNRRPDIPLRTVANENDIQTTEADQLRTAVQEVIKLATLQGKAAERDDSEKNKLQTELATLQAKKDASEKNLKMELAEKDALQTELATLKAEKDASEKKLQTELAEKDALQTELATLQGKVAEKDASEKKLLAEVRAAHFEERTS